MRLAIVFAAALGAAVGRAVAAARAQEPGYHVTGEGGVAHLHFSDHALLAGLSFKVN